jgi:hypothetical protein
MAKHDAKKVKGATSPPSPERLGLQWLDDVADHDFDAALAYLSLKLGNCSGPLRVASTTCTVDARTVGNSTPRSHS